MLEYMVETLYLGMDTLLKFWCEYLEKLVPSENRTLTLCMGTKCEHSPRDELSGGASQSPFWASTG